MSIMFGYVANVGSNLNHEDIGTACTAFSIIADQVTDGDRLAWGIWVHGTEVGIDFLCEGCRDRFAAIVADGTEAVRPSRSKADPAHRPAPAHRRSRRTTRR